jgi:hypothetical protein
MPDCIGCGIEIEGGLLKVLLDQNPPCGLGCDSNGLFYKNIASSTVDNRETTTSTIYTDLPTVGPSVSVQTGPRALVFYDAWVQGNGTEVGFMSIEVSGASVVLASDSVSLGWPGTTDLSLSGHFLFTTLTSGLNTFTAKYRSETGGQVVFEFRKLQVIY